MTDVIQISITRARYIHWTSCSKSETYYFILNSLDIKNKNSHTETNERQQWSYVTTLTTHIYWVWVLHWPHVTSKMDSGILFHTLYVTITNSQCHKNLENTYHHSLQSFLLILLWRSSDSGIVKKRALKQEKNTNIIAYRNAGKCP